jgi:tetratricopeptide (TPR) repeat protein
MPDNNAVYAQRHYEAACDNFEQGQYEKALEQIRKAIERAPQNPDYHSTRAIFLHKMNDLASAIEAYRHALEISPNHTFSHFNLGLIYMKMGKPVDAIKEWEAVLRLKPNDVDSLFNVAVALSQLGRINESVPFYERVLRFNPDHVQSHQNLGLIFRDQKQFAKARKHLLRLQELDATYVELVDQEIERLGEQEFLDQVVATQTNLDTLESDLAGLGTKDSDADRVSLALMAILRSDFSAALDVANEILVTEPDNLQARLVKGQALAGLGQNHDAIALFMAITTENPDCAEGFFHLGNLFLGLGELTQALDHFQRVKGLEGHFPLIDENLAAIQRRLAREEG